MGAEGAGGVRGCAPLARARTCDTPRTPPTHPSTHPPTHLYTKTEYYTKTEDRPIVKERVEYIKEHRPVEQEFVVRGRGVGGCMRAGKAVVRAPNYLAQPTPPTHAQVETRATGREREAAEGRATEHLGTREFVVSEDQPSSGYE